MEDDLNFLENGRRPQSFGKWKTISIFRKFNMTSICLQMEDYLNILHKGRRPQYFSQWKTTSIFWKIEDNLKYLEYGIA